MAHLTAQEIDRFQNGECSPAEMDQAQQHIQNCEECRNAVITTSNFQKGFKSLHAQVLSDDHPTFEEMASYVDGDPEYSWIREHVQDCTECDMQVEDMREAKKELPAVHPLTRSTTQRPPVRQMLIAATFLLALLVAAWFFRNSLQKQEPQIVKPVIPEESDTTLVLNDKGHRIEMDAKGKLKPIPALSGEMFAMLEEVVHSGKLPDPPDLKTLHPESDVLLGESQAGVPFPLRYPVGVIVMLQRPRFQWEALPGATTYQVVVADRRLQVAAISDEIRETHWTPQQDLRRGDVYSWQVIAKKGGEEVRSPAAPAPEALFQVLSQDPAAKIEHAKQSGAPTLLIAALMNQAGLSIEAAEQLRQLEPLNQDNPLLTRLLQSTGAGSQKK